MFAHSPTLRALAALRARAPVSAAVGVGLLSLLLVYLLPEFCEFQELRTGEVLFPPQSLVTTAGVAAGVGLVFTAVAAWFLKGHARRGLVLAILLLAWLLGVEGILQVHLRRLVLTRPHPLLGHELIPSNSRTGVNSLGLYGEEVPQRKPAGQFRILVVGDSSAFGWGVELEQRFSNLLEARLRARHPDWDVCVLNAAVPAYSSLTCARLFDLRLARLEPDMVIVSVNNDPAFEARSESQQLPWDASVGPRAALYRSTLYMCLRKVILNSRTRSQEPSPPAGEVPRVSDQEIRQSYIRLLTATRGPSVVLSMPKRDHPASPRIEHVRKLTEEVARQQGAVFVDSYSSFLAAGRVGEAWFSDWVHPRPEGHRLIAEELLPEVERVVAASTPEVIHRSNGRQAK